MSAGADAGVILTALEPRLKASILQGTGIWGDDTPEIDRSLRAARARADADAERALRLRDAARHRAAAAVRPARLRAGRQAPCRVRHRARAADGRRVARAAAVARSLPGARPAPPGHGFERGASVSTPRARRANARMSARSSICLLGRLAGAVAGPGLDADQHRRRAALRRLQRRGELEAVRRHHAVVVVGGRDQRRRIVRPGLEVVQRRVLDQRGEAVLRSRCCRSPTSTPSRS